MERIIIATLSFFRIPSLELWKLLLHLKSTLYVIGTTAVLLRAGLHLIVPFITAVAIVRV